jgi:hypothetical protein
MVKVPVLFILPPKIAVFPTKTEFDTFRMLFVVSLSMAPAEPVVVVFELKTQFATFRVPKLEMAPAVACDKVIPLIESVSLVALFVPLMNTLVLLTLTVIVKR